MDPLGGEDSVILGSPDSNIIIKDNMHTNNNSVDVAIPTEEPRLLSNHIPKNVN